MSTITPEITHLPRFDTTNAELDESVLSLDLRTALGGFVLDETTDFSDAAQSGGALHKQHARVAIQILKAAKWAEDVTAIPEGDPYDFPKAGPKHLDGLVVNFFQLHTTYPSNSGQESIALLEGYDLSEEEHAHMQNLCILEGHPSGSRSIQYKPSYDKHRVEKSTIYDILEGREPDKLITATAGPNTSIVFPNGYDASATSKPGRLYIHSFRTGHSLDYKGERLGGISRLERA